MDKYVREGSSILIGLILAGLIILFAIVGGASFWSALLVLLLTCVGVVVLIAGFYYLSAFLGWLKSKIVRLFS